MDAHAVGIQPLLVLLLLLLWHKYFDFEFNPPPSSINRMLDEMENDLDKTTQRLDFVTQKTKEMIKRSGGKQNFLIIVALIVVAFILILLILYT